MGVDVGGSVPVGVGVEVGATPPVVIRPIRLPANSVNHRLPSGPAVMPEGAAPALMPVLNSVTTPSRCDPPDPVAAEFREPQVAVGAGRDAVRDAHRR